MMRLFYSLALFLAVASPALAAQPAASASTKLPVQVDGFRSAKFGMNDAEVKAAITKDFGIAAEAVRSSEDAVEHTQLLSVDVPDLLPQGGKAQVLYVLGFHSHKLIQVNVTWATSGDPTLTGDKLLANARALQGLFLSEGYKEGTVVTNVVPPTGGLLVFRGLDAHGHLTTLLLQGETKPVKDKEGQQQLTPNLLVLIYSVDPEHPDAMRLQPGQF